MDNSNNKSIYDGQPLIDLEDVQSVQHWTDQWNISSKVLREAVIGAESTEPHKVAVFLKIEDNL